MNKIRERILDIRELPEHKLHVIGTIHSKFTEDHKKDKKRLDDILRKASDLKLEGTMIEVQNYKKIQRSIGKSNFELYAYEREIKDLGFLEEGINWISLAEKFGMNGNLFRCIDALSVLGIVLSYTKGQIEIGEVVIV